MIIRLFNLKIWKTRVNRNCENKTISKKNFNFKTSQKLNFFFVPNEALETKWMNNFYKFCYPIESVESNACWDFNLNRTFSLNFSTSLPFSLSIQWHWRKTAWTFRATRWTTACSTFPARVCAASAFAITPSRSGARPSTVIRPTWVKRFPSIWYILKHLYDFLSLLLDSSVKTSEWVNVAASSNVWIHLARISSIRWVLIIVYRTHNWTLWDFRNVCASVPRFWRATAPPATWRWLRWPCPP